VIESWLKAIRDHPGRPPAAEQLVLERLALRLNWTTGTGFCSVQQLTGDVPAAKRTVLRALAWAQSDSVALLKQTRRGGRKGNGAVVASEWALTVPPSQGADSDPLKTIVKVPEREPQGASGEPASRPVPHQDSQDGDKSRASRRARPAATRDEVIHIVRRAITISYSAAEAEELYDGQAVALWYLLVSSRRPRDPVAYLCKIFGETPDLDTHLANAGTEEDWT